MGGQQVAEGGGENGGVQEESQSPNRGSQLHRRKRKRAEGVSRGGSTAEGSPSAQSSSSASSSSASEGDGDGPVQNSPMLSAREGVAPAGREGLGSQLQTQSSKSVVETDSRTHMDAVTSLNGEEDRRNFKLVVKSSRVLEVGRSFSLTSGSQLTIGRQASVSNIVVKDLMVSKKHARLTAAPKFGPCVYDLKSKHGTVASVRKPGAKGGDEDVKRFPVPVPPEGLMLRIGDQVSVGGTVLVLELEDGNNNANPTDNNDREPAAGGATSAGGQGGSET